MTSIMFLIFCHLLYGVETRGTAQSYTQDGGCIYRDSLEIMALRFLILIARLTWKHIFKSVLGYVVWQPGGIVRIQDLVA